LPLASIIIIIRLAAAVAAPLTCVCTCPNFIVRLLTFTWFIGVGVFMECGCEFLETLDRRSANHALLQVEVTWV
jgi:hypothetical protein